jgi:uncharacterized protein (DUF488 family)
MNTNMLISPKLVRVTWRVDDTPCLFTVGYEGLSIDAYIDKLLAKNIRVLIDVRSNPLSRKPGFSKNAFSEHLLKAGISYIHIPELGVPSARRKNLGTEQSYRDLFRYYEEEILAYNLDSIEKIKATLEKHSRAALTCFEADHLTCHRHKITEHLCREPAFSTEIIHLN